MNGMISPPPGIQVPDMPGQVASSGSANMKTGLNEKTKNAIGNILGGTSPTMTIEKGPNAPLKSKHLDESTVKGIAGILKSMVTPKDDPGTLVEKAKPVLEFAQDWDSADEFVGYLQTTLIPDLKDSGSVETATDFEQAVNLIQDGIYDAEFVGYLTKTLIPELKASGLAMTAQDFETAVDFIKMGRVESKKVLESDVKDWISSKINAALISLGISQEKWDSVEDSVFSSALSGKLGDGTPSEETAQAIASMVTELVGTSAAPAPELEEPGEGEEIGAAVGLDREVDVVIPDDEEGIAGLLSTMAGGDDGDEGEPLEQDPEMVAAVSEFLAANPNPEDEELHAWAEAMGYDVDEVEEVAYNLAAKHVNEPEGEGKAAEAGLTPDEVDPDELAMGIEVEKEHTDDEAEAERIALDHLAEMPDYYSRLKAMEREAGVGESSRLAAKPAFCSGDTVMVERNGDLFEAIVIDTAHVVYLDRGDGVLFEAEFGAVKPLGVADSYIQRIMDGGDISEILEEIVIDDTIRR